MDIKKAFRRFAAADDLPEAGQTLTIDSPAVDTVRVHDPATHRERDRFQLHIRGAGKTILLSHTLADDIAQVLGNETDAWTGKRITLYPAVMHVAGRDTTTIRARAATNGTHQPATEPEAT